MVVRDILLPWHDPVRMDGLSDDPLGGVLDEGIDTEDESDRPWRDPGPSPLTERLNWYTGDARQGLDEPPGDPDQDPIYAP